ncbi:DUF3426 domain-containing protein, partial [Ideonella sp. A 288]|uniref:DUF3426 domain-containing protein n=1 Tax=Ideonella sp. A 288 TaxID=1962181 RepID=UPI001F1C1E03
GGQQGLQRQLGPTAAPTAPEPVGHDRSSLAAMGVVAAHEAPLPTQAHLPMAPMPPSLTPSSRDDVPVRDSILDMAPAPDDFRQEPAFDVDMPPLSVESPRAEPHEFPPPSDDQPAVVVSVGETLGTPHAAPPDASPVQIDADETDRPGPTPSFLQTEDSGATVWRRPAVVGGLVTAAVLLSLAAVVQSAVAWRDTLAAHVPALQPALQTLCDGVGCRLAAPRRIDRLSVDASGLTRIEGSPLHRLSVTLRNRADTAVLAPALDLTLSDAQGKLISRRVLQAADFGLNSPSIEAGAELPLQALLSTGDRRIAGYTVELFYP